MGFTEKFLEEFIKRTKVNLKFLQTAYAYGEKVFEVTQFINSLLGLLVFPKAELDNQIDNKTSLDTLRKKGWEIPNLTICKNNNWNNLYDFIRHMRNGVSHSRIELCSNDDKEVSGITIWDQLNKKAPKNWEVKFTIQQLMKFTEKMTQYFLSLSSELPGGNC